MPPKRRSQTASSSARAAKKAKPAPSSSSSSSHELPESTILKPYDISKVYRLLEPGPVLLVTTSSASKSKTDSEHNYNVMTMGFHMVVQHSDPPLLACVIGPWDHSYKALQETKECVLCIPGADLVERVVDIGNVSSTELEVDKFSKFNLTKTRASEEIQHGAPLIEECLACIECIVHDRSMVKKYNMWVLEVVGAWTNGTREEKRMMHHMGIGNFVLDGEEVDLRERMVKWKEFQDDDEEEEEG
ncbi:hypothetical protein EXIGLDRAFT_658176 [Exidia glandulosa HHB12029]|uniref:Flavin reductase like domain-containing protein n=1 Tax=Exidia glandulosa HHB12029 TaxID=1314781 RepID=A0A165BZ69_EXIGL|nr:hypothetical protein EXIGLDRAFT_658176 [Exidia glandulosa HHB12029]